MVTTFHRATEFFFDTSLHLHDTFKMDDAFLCARIHQEEPCNQQVQSGSPCQWSCHVEMGLQQNEAPIATLPGKHRLTSTRTKWYLPCAYHPAEGMNTIDIYKHINALGRKIKWFLDCVLKMSRVSEAEWPSFQWHMSTGKLSRDMFEPRIHTRSKSLCLTQTL